MVVGLTAGVLHELQGLQVRAWHVEALEGEGAVLDAADGGVADEAGGLRGAGLAEALSPGFIGDGGLGEGAFAGRVLVSEEKKWRGGRIEKWCLGLES